VAAAADPGARGVDTPRRAPEGRGLRILLLGAPGAGKGTQSALLAERLGIPAVSTGDLLRGAVAAGNPLGRRVADVLAAGGLVEDGLMAELVGERLGRPDAQAGFLLDGYPRTAEQARALEGLLEGLDGGLDAVVYLRVPEETLVRRALGRGRQDDREEVVRERLRLYRENTEPLIGYYRERGLLREVDGARPMGEVTSQILSALAVRA
jgi:adenylate kinase